MEKRRKRVLSLLLTAAMLLPMVPQMIVPTAAAAQDEKAPIDEAAFNALGFNTNVQNDEDNYLAAGTKSTMWAQHELYFDFNGSSNYGWIMRDNLKLYGKENGDGSNQGTLENTGAYQLYGQYHNGDWAKLKPENGYNYGQTGGETLSSSLTSDNSHQGRAYATAVAFRSSSGKDDHIAQLYVTSPKAGVDWSGYRVYLEIISFNDKYQPRRSFWIPLPLTGALGAAADSRLLSSLNNETFDALYELAAGDFDGDGVDEIAVHFGTDEVRIYDTGKNGNSLTPSQTINLGFNAGIGYYPVVSLSAGDINRDFRDDLAIGVSTNPMASDADEAKATLYDFKDKLDNAPTAVWTSKDLRSPDSKATVGGVSVAIGDVTGSSIPSLIVSAEECSKKSLLPNMVTDGFALNKIDYLQGSASESGALLYKGSGNAEHVTTKFRRYWNGTYKAPQGLAAAQLGTLGAEDNCYLLVGGDLLQYNSSGNWDYKRSLNYSTRQKDNDNKDKDKENVWISSIVVGNFTGDKSGRQQIMAVIGSKQSGQESYWYQVAYLTKNDNGKLQSSWEGIISQATSYLNRGDKSRASCYVALSAVDVDRDSLELTFKGSETYYTKPEVQAILQSSPYFQDVEDSYGYLGNSETTFGKSKSTGHAVTGSVSASVGAYVSIEGSFFASADFESEVKATTEYEHSTQWETSYSQTYVGAAGDDYVVMYTVPYHRYYYDAYDPEKKKTSPIWIDAPLTPGTVIVSVDTYDELAEQYEGLEPIRGNLITSTPGDPETYRSWAAGSFQTVGDFNITNTPGSRFELEKEKETSHENSVAIGAEVSMKVGAGAGFLGNDATAGVVADAGVSAGYVNSNTSGQSYGGSIENLPTEAKDYAMSGSFGVGESKLNGEDVVVVGYKVNDVKSAPRTPKELSVTDVTVNTVDLEWNATSDAAVYQVYQEYGSGTWAAVQTLSGASADEDGTVKTTIRNLSANTKYRFKVRSINGGGVASLFTPVVDATTAQESGVGLKITSQPSDAEAAPGNPASFTVKAQAVGNGRINYQWQTYDTNHKTWSEVFPGYNSSTLQLTASAENDGSRYRCMVYQGGLYLNSAVATLTVGRSVSSTALTVKNGGAEVKDNDTVQAGYQKQGEPISTPVETEVTTKVGDKTYRQMQVDDAHDAHRVWADSDGGYYAVNENDSVGAPYKTVIESYTFTLPQEMNEQNEVTQPEQDFTTAAQETTVSEVTIEDQETTAAYSINGKEGYIYIVRTGTDADAETKYYCKVGDTYKQVSLITQTMSITIGEEKYDPNTFMQIMEEKTVSIPSNEYTTVVGDELSLSAAVTSDGTAVADANVKYMIINKSTGATVTVDSSSYSFPEPGVYTIQAVYAGSEVYQPSRSEVLTVIAVPHQNAAQEQKLTLNGGSITYGQSVDLNPTLLSKDVTSHPTVTYTIQRTDSTAAVSTDGICGNVFTPAEKGEYVIEASYANGSDKLTASARVSVSALAITVRAKDASTNVTAEDKASMLTYELWQGDRQLDKNSVHYGALKDAFTLTSPATAADAVKGTYPINITVKDAKKAELEKKYSFVLNTGTFTLVEDSVSVAFSGEANGTVSASYQSGNTSITLPDANAMVPKGVDISFAAQPAAGYTLDHWTVNGQEQNDKNAILQQTANGNLTVVAYFAPTYTTLSFKADGNGTVSANYATGEQAALGSGDRVSAGDKIVLKAIPDAGYVLSHWTKQVGNDTVNVTDENGIVTSDTLTVSGITQPTTYTAHFISKTAQQITLRFVDRNGTPVTNTTATLTVGDVVTEMVGNGTLTGTAAIHSSPTITITVPNGVTVTKWTENDKVVEQGGVLQHTINQISKNYDFIITCSVANTGILTFAPVWENGTAEGIADAGTLTAKLADRELVSGTPVSRNTAVDFTATVKPGYELVKWTVNGAEQADSVGKTAFTATVSGDTTVQAVYRKKPVITIVNGANGTISVKGTKDGAETTITNGSYVDFGTNLTVTLTPNKGYTVGALGDHTLTEVGAKTDDKTAEIRDVNADMTLEPTWTALDEYTVTYGVHAESGVELHGSLTAAAQRKGMDAYKAESYDSGTTLYSGSIVTFKAAPNAGYRVKQWLVNGTASAFTGDELVLNMPMQGVSSKAYTVYVTFEAISNKITAQAGEGGELTAFTVGGNDQLANAASGVIASDKAIVSVSAQPDTGYEIAGWTKNGAPVTGLVDPSTYTYTVDDASVGAAIMVTFRPFAYEVSWEDTLTAGGYTGTEANIRGGETVHFTAAPAAGQTLTGYTVNDGEPITVSGNAFDWTVPLGVEEGAVYQLKPIYASGSYTVSFDQPEHGSLTAKQGEEDFRSGTAVDGGTKLVFTAEPENGYVLDHWTVNGMESGNTLTVTVNTDLTVGVVFAPKTHTVTFTADGNGTISGKADGTETVEHKSALTLTAVPDANYQVMGWTVSGTDDYTISADRTSLTLNAITSDVSVTARFADAVSYEVSFEVLGANGGLRAMNGTDALTPAVSGGTVAVMGGSTLTFTAAPDNGYMVKAWTVNGTESAELSDTLTISNLSEKTHVTVSFEEYSEWSLPADGEDWHVSVEKRTPETPANDAAKIRNRGTVELTVAPNAADAVLTEVNVTSQTNGVDYRRQPDGTWKVTITGVTADVKLMAVVENGVPITIETPVNGTVSVKRADGTAVASGDKLARNEVLTITASANSGYALDALTVTGAAKRPDGTYTIEDSAAEVHVRAAFRTAGGGFGGGGGGGGSAVQPDTKTITVDNGKGGTVTPSDPNAKPNSKVTLEVKPDTGKKLTDLTVTDDKGGSVELVRRDAAHYEFTMPDGKVNVKTVFGDRSTACSGGIVCPTRDMTDVPLDAWFHDVVDTAVDNGWMNGTGKGQFTPKGSTTRGMLAAVLYRMENSPKAPENTFRDVSKSMYYTDAIAWAAANGIVTGLDADTYAPERSITREQLATMLYRMAQYRKLHPKSSADALNGFADQNSVHDWAQDAMCWAIDSGIVTGKSGAMLDPTGAATRAEVAAMLSRFFDWSSR